MDLGEWIKREGPLSPVHAVGWALRLTKTLQALHQGGEVHGAVSAHAVETIDGDCSAPAVLADADQVRGDPQYHGEERAKGAPPSEADDVWAVGVTLYYALTGAMPFSGATDQDVASRIAWRPASPLSVYDCDAVDVQVVLDRVFSRDRSGRITTATKLRAALDTCRGADDELPLLQLPEEAVAEEDRLERSSASREKVRSQPSAKEEAEPVAKRRAAVAAADARVAKPRSVEAAASKRIDDGGRAARADDGRAARRDLVPWIVLVVVLGAIALYVLRDEDETAAIRAPVASRAEPSAAGSDQAAPARPAPPTTSVRRPVATSVPRLGPSPNASVQASGFSSQAPPPIPTATAAAATSAAATGPDALAPANDEQLRACVLQAFPKGTFAGLQPGFAFICETSDPHEGAKITRSRVVWARQGRLLTEAMREWSQLGWYEMAAFALIQARCCAKPPKLRTPVFVASCQLDDALNVFSAAARGTARKAFDAALERYSKAVECAAHAGAGAYFGHDKLPSGNETVLLERILGRFEPAP